MMADHIDGKLRETFQQHGLVTGPHRFLDFGEDKEVGHGAPRIVANRAMGNNRVQVTRMVGLR
jgi:hypothetical protein